MFATGLRPSRVVFFSHDADETTTATASPDGSVLVSGIVKALCRRCASAVVAGVVGMPAGCARSECTMHASCNATKSTSNGNTTLPGPLHSNECSLLLLLSAV